MAVMPATAALGRGRVRLREKTMSTKIRSAQPEDVPHIAALVNRFAAQNLMLPRTETSIAQTVQDWVVATPADEQAATGDVPPIVGCGALVPLTETLVELRSLAVDESQHGQGLGSKLVLALVDMAQTRGYPQICALTLREDFFVRLGFHLVDRWSISPKVWQACIYCPKFHRCDEVAVLMHLQPQAGQPPEPRPAAWNRLLKWDSWQPLRLAYQHKPAHATGPSSQGEEVDAGNPRFG